MNASPHDPSTREAGLCADSANQPLTQHSWEKLATRPFPLWKRLMDITGALLALILFSPLMAVVALAIRLTSHGPILFKQWRGGYLGRPFVLYKFRSMTVDAELRKAELIAYNERKGPAFKMRNDPRITTVGRIIRRTSLDELPQFFNVLRGDMSLVGPRPLPIEEDQQYDQWHWRRLETKPGLTCFWQVFHRDDHDFDRWVRLDIRYIERRSFWLDIVLILLTIPAVLLRRGAH